MTSTDDRPVGRLTAESLETYFRAAVPTVHLLSRTPRCELRIDPRPETYELLTPAEGAMPDVRGMERIAVDIVEVDGEERYRLLVAARDLRYEAYGFVISVVQGMRGGASFASATGAALTNLRSIIAARRRLSSEQQLGLTGELLLARHLLRSAPERDVLDCWLGPLAEQHDFALPHVDLEVKTTVSERRVHVISGTGQLRPNPGRPLWLVSIQLTRAGGADGISLAGLVAQVRSQLSAHLSRFTEHLAALGWRDDDGDLYHDRYLLRSAPAAYLVDEDFPALTPERLASAVPHSDLVSAVSYRVDVSGRVPGLPGEPVDSFLHTRDGHHE
jgi:hypothetical protein